MEDPTRPATYMPGLNEVVIYMNFGLFKMMHAHFMRQYGDIVVAETKVQTAIHSVYALAIVSRIVHASLISEEGLTAAVLGIHDAMKQIEAKLCWLNKLAKTEVADVAT